MNESMITEAMRKALNTETSDLFITAGKRVWFRRKGEVIAESGSPVPAEEIDTFRRSLLSQDMEALYLKNGSNDASCSISDARFRINFFATMNGPAMAVRPIRSGNSLTFEHLNLPLFLKNFCDETRGLILVSGSTGSGKSTTLAAMVNYINKKYHRHILTIEDPIEYQHEDVLSLVSQREINSDSSGFAESLRSAMRENPDVIVIGEMRDAETVQSALNAALTGHLLISTVHTTDTVQAVERILSLFPENQREQAAVDLGMALNVITSQRLIPAADRSGMIPAVEILSGTPTVRKQITDRDFRSLEDTLRGNVGEEMITFNRAIYKLYKTGRITQDAAMKSVSSRDEFNLLLKGMESGIDTFRNHYSDSGIDGIDMRRLLRTALKNGASDLILSCGAPPMLRLNGVLRAMELPVLGRLDIQRLLFSLITRNQRIELEEKRELDFALSVTLNNGSENETSARFRINGFYQRSSLGVVARVVNSTIPKPEELSLPQAIVDLVSKQQGLILITGPTGTGKSTTMASLINLINRTRAAHIITVEDPIEYVHDNLFSIVEQRELHADTLSFANSLKYALRQNPDVIMVGEMRDIETIAAALTAAETGHLVLGTIHTNSAPQTIDRIVDSFPTEHQNQIRLQLAGVLLGVLSQRLLPRIDGNGRIAAFEVMIGTPPVQALVRDGNTHQLQSVIETSHKDGMVTLEKSLENLYARGLVSLEETKKFKADYKPVREF